MSESQIISVNGLGKEFVTKGSKVEALRDFSFYVHDGEFVAIAGPSGCGKSTFLKIVAGLIPFDSGTLTILGEPVHAPTAGIGMVFQRPVLMPWRTVLKNIMFAAEIRKLDTQKCLARVEELIKLVGLSGFEKMYPFELSGGMEQRVSLCRALLTDPPILLMDEPFGALDAITREQMDMELRRITSSKGEKHTVLFVTHNVAEAIFLANRVLVMTKRPGKVKRVIDIDLPFKRDLSVMGTPEFARYTALVRDELMNQ